MARQIEFCRETALRNAIAVFWDKGYEGASLEDLVTAMGIGRQSLYNTYGDKRGLFLQAVSAQIDYYHKLMAEHFARPGSVITCFKAWFDGLAQRANRSKRMGCLLINTTMELAGRDLEVADLMARNQRLQEGVFLGALQHGVADAELDPHCDCQALARYFVGVMAGMIVLAKADPNSPALHDMAAIAVRILPKSSQVVS